MKSMTTAAKAWIAAGVVAMLAGAGAPAVAQVRTYEGDIVAVDAGARTFAVKGSEPGTVPRMVFTVAKGQILIKGEERVLGELSLGDHVVVLYVPAGAGATIERVDRLRTMARESEWSGVVSHVDAKAQTFTVTPADRDRGMPAAMTFHLSPQSRLYLGTLEYQGGEDVLATRIHPGDSVVVAYETVGATVYAKLVAVKKGA